MLRKVLSGLIEGVIGSYVEDVNSEKLSIGLLNGNLSLSQLQLKRDTLHRLFDIPLVLEKALSAGGSGVTSADERFANGTRSGTDVNAPSTSAPSKATSSATPTVDPKVYLAEMEEKWWQTIHSTGVNDATALAAVVAMNPNADTSSCITKWWQYAAGEIRPQLRPFFHSTLRALSLATLAAEAKSNLLYVKAYTTYLVRGLTKANVSSTDEADLTDNSSPFLEAATSDQSALQKDNENDVFRSKADEDWPVGRIATLRLVAMRQAASKLHRFVSGNQNGSTPRSLSTGAYSERFRIHAGGGFGGFSNLGILSTPTVRGDQGTHSSQHSGYARRDRSTFCATGLHLQTFVSSKAISSLASTFGHLRTTLVAARSADQLRYRPLSRVPQSHFPVIGLLCDFGHMKVSNWPERDVSEESLLKSTVVSTGNTEDDTTSSFQKPVLYVLSPSCLTGQLRRRRTQSSLSRAPALMQSRLIQIEFTASLGDLKLQLSRQFCKATVQLSEFVTREHQLMERFRRRPKCPIIGNTPIRLQTVLYESYIVQLENLHVLVGELNTLEKLGLWTNPVDEHTEVLEANGDQPESTREGVSSDLCQFSRTNSRLMSQFCLIDRFNVRLLVSRRITPSCELVRFDCMSNQNEIANYPPSLWFTVEQERCVLQLSDVKIDKLLRCLSVHGGDPSDTVEPMNGRPNNSQTPIARPSLRRSASCRHSKLSASRSANKHPSSSLDFSSQKKRLIATFNVKELIVQLENKGYPVAECRLEDASGTWIRLAGRGAGYQGRIRVSGFSIADAMANLGGDYDLVVASHQHIRLNSVGQLEVLPTRQKPSSSLHDPIYSRIRSCSKPTNDLQPPDGHAVPLLHFNEQATGSDLLQIYFDWMPSVEHTTVQSSGARHRQSAGVRTLRIHLDRLDVVCK
ncbi:hypothetical protein AHF37_05605 [Paragonimus kellicotti]|nr:hypothetical protein AHF37_05605 [Paragonimus kellicotti]